MRASTSLPAGLARRSPSVLTAEGPLRQAPRGAWAPRPRSHPLQSLAQCQPQPSAACSMWGGGPVLLPRRSSHSTRAAAGAGSSSGGSTSGARGSAAEPAPARAPPGGAREAQMRPAPPSRTGRGGVGGGSGRGMGGRGRGVTGGQGGASSSGSGGGSGGGTDGGRGTGPRKPLGGRGGGAAGGGDRQPLGGGGGDSASAATDTRSALDLPSLAALVQAQAAQWAAAGDRDSFFGAFNKAGKLGMAPNQRPREDDPQRAALQHRTLDDLAAAYLPLVPQLPAAKWCVGPLWACAKAGYWGGGLAEELLQRLGRDGGALMRQANGQDHGNVWWSLSEAPGELVQPGGMAWEVLHASADSLLGMTSQLNAQNYSNVLLACARLGHSDPGLLHHLTASLAAHPDASCQALANGLYALGKLREECGHTPQPQDLQRLADAVAGRLAGAIEGAGGARWGSRGGDKFIPQHFSNMLLGCAKLGYADPALLLPLTAAAGWAAARMKEQELANSLHALAELGCKDPAYAPVVAQLAAACKRQGFADFTAQGLAISVWAMSKLGSYSDPTWFTAAVAAAMRPDTVKTLSSQNFANIWYGLALVRHPPSRALLESTSAVSEVLRTQATGQECANLLWSLATLEVPHEPRLVSVLLGRLVELLPQQGEVVVKSLANSLWALAVMGPRVLSHHRRHVEVLLREVVRRWGGGGVAQAGTRSDRAEFNIAELTQLWQVQQTLEQADGCSGLAGIMADGGGAASAGSLMDAMQRAAKQTKRAGAHSRAENE